MEKMTKKGVRRVEENAKVNITWKNAEGYKNLLNRTTELIQQVQNNLALINEMHYDIDVELVRSDQFNQNKGNCSNSNDVFLIIDVNKTNIQDVIDKYLRMKNSN